MMCMERHVCVGGWVGVAHNIVYAKMDNKCSKKDTICKLGKCKLRGMEAIANASCLGRPLSVCSVPEWP